MTVAVPNEKQHVSRTLKDAFQQSKNLMRKTLPSVDDWQDFENSSLGALQNSNRM